MSQKVMTIKEAVDSGLWREKTHAKNGRVYYVNPRTRKSVWDLEAELKRAAEAGELDNKPQRAAAAEQSPKTAREERHEKLRKRAEAEAQLKATIASLETQKVELESEIARLQAPVEAESAAIETLRQEVSDAGYSLAAVETEAMERRRQRASELQAVQSKVAALQSVVESEKKHREAVDQRHQQLVAESLDLKADLQKEQTTTESLKAAVRDAERKLEEANATLSRQRVEITDREDQVAAAERDLADVCKRKTDVLQEIEDYRKELRELQAHADRVKAANTGKASPRDGPAGMDLLQKLTTKFETKQKQMHDLERLESVESDVTKSHRANAMLRRLVDDAKRDKASLEQTLRLVNHETRRANEVTAHYQKRLKEVEAELQSLPQPRDWPY